MFNHEIAKKYAPVVLRISIASVYMWFGVSQLTNPEQWTRLVPDWIGEIIQPATLVYLNGILEVVLSFALAVGFYVRYVAAVLALHLFAITFHLGLVANGVRDFGLSFATLAIALWGDDEFSVKQ